MRGVNKSTDLACSVLVACSVLDSREYAGWGVARVCVLHGERRRPNSAAGRRVRIRAYHDLRRLSPPTPEPLRLQRLPCAVWASTLWEQRACVLDGAIGRDPAQVRVSGGLLCERCAVHGAARSAAHEASTAARRRMRVRTIAGLEVERVSGGAPWRCA